MKRCLKLLILVAVLGILPLSGIQAAEIRIGIIDTQRIMMDSTKVNQLRANFFKELENKRNEILGMQKNAQMLEEELKTKGFSMTAETRKEKSDQLSRQVRQINRMMEEIEADAQRRDEELSRRFLRELGEIVDEYQKKEKYTVIFERNMVAVYDSAIDITDRIMREYDSRK